MKVKNQQKLPFKVYQGSPEETRDMVISRLVDIMGNDLPEEYYTLLGQLVNQKFLETPVEAIHKDLETLNSRIKHLEASMNLRDQTPRRNFAAQR